MNKKKKLVIWFVAIVIFISLVSMVNFIYNLDSGSAEKKDENFAETSKVKNYNIPNTVIFPEKGMVAPDFSLPDLNGKSISLSQFKGKKVILNFWATWCKYCIEEMPDFEKLNKVVGKDYNAVIVAIDVMETPELVNSFVKNNNLQLNNILLDESGATAEEYGVNGFPNTFILNEDGSVFAVIAGMTNKETILAILYKMQGQ